MGNALFINSHFILKISLEKNTNQGYLVFKIPAQGLMTVLARALSATDCRAAGKCRSSLLERIQAVTRHRVLRWAQLSLLAPHSKAEVGFIPRFAQVSSKPQRGLPSTEGAGFSRAFQLLSLLGHPETAESRGRNWQWDMQNSMSPELSPSSRGDKYLLYRWFNAPENAGNSPVTSFLCTDLLCICP